MKVYTQQWRLDRMLDGSVVSRLPGNDWRHLYDQGIEWVYDVPASVYWSDVFDADSDMLPGRDFIIVPFWSITVYEPASLVKEAS